MWDETGDGILDEIEMKMHMKTSGQDYPKKTKSEGMKTFRQKRGLKKN